MRAGSGTDEGGAGGGTVEGAEPRGEGETREMEKRWGRGEKTEAKQTSRGWGDSKVPGGRSEKAHNRSWERVRRKERK